MAARNYARLTLEQTYGVFSTQTGPTLWANQVVPMLVSANDDMVRATPDFWELASAGSSNRLVMRGSERYMVGGKISMIGFGAQTKTLMTIIAAIASSSGAPYTIPSFTYESAHWLDDGSQLVSNRSLGMVVRKATIKASNTSPLFHVDLDVVGASQASINATTTTSTLFPPPTFSTTAPTPPASIYPYTDPIAFQDTNNAGGGAISIGGTQLTNYAEFELTIDNNIKPVFDEYPTAQAMRWRGRRISLTIRERYIATGNRTNFNAVTNQAVTFTFYDGTNTGVFDMKGYNYITSIADNMPIDDDYFQSVTLTNQLDPTGGATTDLAYTQTP